MIERKNNLVVERVKEAPRVTRGEEMFECS